MWKRWAWWHRPAGKAETGWSGLAAHTAKKEEGPGQITGDWLIKNKAQDIVSIGHVHTCACRCKHPHLHHPQKWKRWLANIRQELKIQYSHWKICHILIKLSNLTSRYLHKIQVSVLICTVILDSFILTAPNCKQPTDTHQLVQHTRRPIEFIQQNTLSKEKELSGNMSDSPKHHGES